MRRVFFLVTATGLPSKGGQGTSDLHPSPLIKGEGSM